MSATGRCRDCHATFAGNQNHCTLCHQTFATELGGDSHRVGPYEPPGARRCRDATELYAGGMWTKPNAGGTPVWHGRWSSTGKQRRHPRVTPWTDSHPVSGRATLGTG